MFIISQLWLTFHPRSTVVLLDTETPGTSREIYSEDADDGTRMRSEPQLRNDKHIMKLNNVSDTLSDDTYRPIIRNLRDFVPQFVKMLDKPIDVDGIKKTALKLKNGKSVGIDLISNEIIKCCVGSHFVRLIRELFNFILVESKVPT